MTARAKQPVQEVLNSEQLHHKLKLTVQQRQSKALRGRGQTGGGQVRLAPSGHQVPGPRAPARR